MMDTPVITEQLMKLLAGLRVPKAAGLACLNVPEAEQWEIMRRVVELYKKNGAVSEQEVLNILVETEPE